MKVNRIQIEQQMAKIQVESQRAALKVEQNIRRMKVKSEAAKMSVERQEGYVDIDMTALLENTARKSALSLQRSFAAKSSATAQQGIQETASDGNFTAQQPHGEESLIAELARHKLMSVQTPSANRNIVPTNPVEVTGHAGGVTVDWTPHDIDIQWDPMQSPSISLEPEPSVVVQLAQRPELNCTVVELTIPAESGQNIDTTA